MKTCTTCKKTYSIDQFPVTGGTKRPNKRSGKCIACFNAARRGTRSNEKMRYKEKKYTIDLIRCKVLRGYRGVTQSPLMMSIVQRNTAWMSDNVSDQQRLYHIKTETCSIGKCKHCHIHDQMFMLYKNEYSEFCSVECSKEYNRLARLLSNKQKMIRYNKRYPHIYAWRSVLNNALVRMQRVKDGRTVVLLGYTAERLRTHLENQFKDGMTWNNYGEWHVDHKKAVTSFYTDTPMSIVNALSNLQPMWASENISKGNK